MYVALGCVLAGVWLAGCSGPSELDSPDAGRSAAYQPGLPNFDMEVLATLRAGEPGLDLYLSLPHASLVYTRDGSGFKARARYDVVVRNDDGGGRVRSAQYADTLRLPTYASTQSFRPFIRQERLEVEPGTYVVEVTLTDEETSKTVEHVQRVTVPGSFGEPAMSRMHIEVKRPGEAFEPHVALSVPTGFDSLRSTIDLYQIRAGAILRLQLQQLESDTSVARSGFWLSYARSSLQFKGVDFDAAPMDTIQATSRTLELGANVVTVEINLPPLEPGMYRILMEARAEEGQPPFAEQSREFAVRQADFPRLTEVDDLISALAYIASEREYEFISEGETLLERRRRFDAFWGSLFNDRRVASGIVRLYYERVEQANLLFTTHKEGWKTDRGMVYVLFGPPHYVENRLDTETWHYDLSSRSGLSTFVFERASFYSARRPAFENWVLQRSNSYETVWRRAIRRWRQGTTR
jgi:GWxTD domain-containing protein